MRRKILMTKEQGCVWTYLLEEDEIVEIHCTPQCESDKTPVALGNIYIGRVDNIVANIATICKKEGKKRDLCCEIYLGSSHQAILHIFSHHLYVLLYNVR